MKHPDKMRLNIRKNALLRRKQLTGEEVADKSRRLQKRLCKLEDFINSHSILFYAAHQNEARTEAAIKKALQLKKKVVLPLVDVKNKQLTLARLSNYPDGLEKGPFGIAQPKKECLKTVKLEEIDLVILPGTAFDIKGNRLGYGAGYYDKLLEHKRTNTTLIGLAYELQLVNNIPNMPHDIPVNKIITENRLILCNP